MSPFAWHIIRVTRYVPTSETLKSDFSLFSTFLYHFWCRYSIKVVFSSKVCLLKLLSLYFTELLSSTSFPCTHFSLSSLLFHCTLLLSNSLLFLILCSFHSLLRLQFETTHIFFSSLFSSSHPLCSNSSFQFQLLSSTLLFSLLSLSPLMIFHQFSLQALNFFSFSSLNPSFLLNSMPLSSVLTCAVVS